MLDSLLVDVGRSIVLLLVDLVTKGILGGGGTVDSNVRSSVW